MLSPGTKAPEFTLPSTSGKDFSLSTDLKGKPCMLYFYPKDFTKGCINQACGFRDTFATFQNFDITVIGISRDDIPTHLKFKEFYNLPFDLLEDKDGTISKLYDTVPTIMPFFTKRTTYLLDQSHKIVAGYENIFSSAKHIETMISTVKADKYSFSK